MRYEEKPSTSRTALGGPKGKAVVTGTPSLSSRSPGQEETMVKGSEMSSLKPGCKGVRSGGRGRAQVSGFTKRTAAGGDVTFPLAERRHGVLEVSALPGPRLAGHVSGRHAPGSTVQVRQSHQVPSRLPQILCSQLCCAESLTTGSWCGGCMVVMYECTLYRKLIINVL